MRMWVPPMASLSGFGIPWCHSCSVGRFCCIRSTRICGGCGCGCDIFDQLDPQPGDFQVPQMRPLKKKGGGFVRMITCIPGTCLFLSYNSKTNDKAMVRPEPGHEFKAGRKKMPSLSVALTDLLFALPKGTLPRGWQLFETKRCGWSQGASSIRQPHFTRGGDPRCFHPPHHLCAGVCKQTRSLPWVPEARHHVSSCPFVLTTGFSSPEQNSTAIRWGSGLHLFCKVGRRPFERGGGRGLAWQGCSQVHLRAGGFYERVPIGSGNKTLKATCAQESLGQSHTPGRMHTPVRSAIFLVVIDRTQGKWKSSSQGTNPSHSCKLHHSCGNARSLSQAGAIEPKPL